MKCGYICDLDVAYTSGRKIYFGGVVVLRELCGLQFVIHTFRIGLYDSPDFFSYISLYTNISPSIE